MALIFFSGYTTMFDSVIRAGLAGFPKIAFSVLSYLTYEQSQMAYLIWGPFLQNLLCVFVCVIQAGVSLFYFKFL